MSHNAIYAFSADPITYGHIDIITRAAMSFDTLIVAIGKNPHKSYIFETDERLQMAQKALEHLPQVKVMLFSGLLTDFAKRQGATIIVRGIRSASDFDYEQQLFQIGLSQHPGIEFHFLLASPTLGHVSSSAVKAIHMEGGTISEYVPLHVEKALNQKLLCHE